MTDPMQSSDAKPRGSAGLVNQGSPSTVESVGPVYGAEIEAAVTAAMDKRNQDWAALATPNMSDPGTHTA